MVSDLILKINSAIKYSFYALFFLVPLVMWPDTYELFEFNKMWVVFGISVLIFFLWGSKIVLQGRIEVRKTPLDGPIALFLISQVISTIASIDPHVSLWGYYSRFNGGLFSIISYIFLYYAFASNLTKNANEESHEKRENSGSKNPQPISYKLLLVSLFSGLVVTLWGIPSHFGYDPTCLVFRGALNVSCWTESFQPLVRIFSTLGQPNWMGTFLAILTPIALGFGIYKLNEGRNKLSPIIYLLLSILFFVALLWTRSQSSFLGLAIGMVLFLGLYIFLKIKHHKISALIKQKSIRYVAGILGLFLIVTFLIGTPISSLNRYVTKTGILELLKSKTQKQEPVPKHINVQETFQIPQIEYGGTESSKIRLIVWRGAIEIFKQNPIFGTGVETFAYAYYKVKPLAHNLTSEWDYLYNKAHNEYLNYLATTGIFGLLTYLLIIVSFYYKSIKFILRERQETPNSIAISILGGWTAIIISNFFGFSVVIVNLLFFFLPIFFFELSDPKVFTRSFIIPKKSQDSKEGKIGVGKMTGIVMIGIIAIYFESYLLNFWFADRRYALGYNLNKAAEFTQAWTPLSDAVKMLPGEDLYKDELSINMATLAVLLQQQNQSTQAAQFAFQAKQLSDEVIRKHPNNVVFYKTRARVAFALSQIDPSLLDLAIQTVNDAQKLAPTDAKLAYHLALFYNQKGNNEKTIQFLKEATRLKPNYIDAYYALGLSYSQLAKQNPKGSLEYNKKARETLEYILKNIDPKHTASKELLKSL